MRWPFSPKSGKLASEVERIATVVPSTPPATRIATSCRKPEHGGDDCIDLAGLELGGGFALGAHLPAAIIDKAATTSKICGAAIGIIA